MPIMAAQKGMQVTTAGVLSGMCDSGKVPHSGMRWLWICSNRSITSILVLSELNYMKNYIKPCFKHI